MGAKSYIRDPMSSMLNEKEHALLNLLRHNSRQTVTALAEQLGISRPTLQNMMDKLEDVAIARYTVELKPTFAHALIRAFVLLNRDPKKSTEIVDVLGKFPHVKYVCTVTGQFDVLVELEAESYEDLEGILNGIEVIDGVVRTQTYMVLAEKHQARGT